MRTPPFSLLMRLNGLSSVQWAASVLKLSSVDWIASHCHVRVVLLYLQVEVTLPHEYQGVGIALLNKRKGQMTVSRSVSRRWRCTFRVCRRPHIYTAITLRACWYVSTCHHRALKRTT